MLLDPSFVESDSGIQQINCKNIVIATGSKPIEVASNYGDKVINTEDALKIEKLPKSIIILGGDILGVEFAYLFNKFGMEVTMVEKSAHILPSEDQEVALQLQRSLRRNNIKVLTGLELFNVEKGKVSIDLKKLTEEQRAEKILITQRKPNLDDLALSDLGIKVDEDRISVNEKMETTKKNIYAVGDVIGGTYAHVAFSEGIVAAENIMQKEATMNYRVIPRCIYITPEVASVGLTEETARKQGHDIKIGKFPFSSSGRSLTLREKDGFVKVVTDSKYGEILGVHIIGPRATDLIAEAALAMKLEITVDELVDVIHAHPTLSEAFKEAALAGYHRAVHLPRRG